MTNRESAVAVIGMACRLPGASNVDEYWQNLVEGRDSVHREYDDSGRITRAGGFVEDLEGFDNETFPMSAREAALLDPQHRMFLEVCWSALESAGLPPGRTENKIGLYGGVGPSTYLINNIIPAMGGSNGRTLLERTEDLQALLATDKDYLTSRVAYLLDLRGPVVTVQAACSTGLVAVHFAVQALLNGECDVAIAGAANASVPQLGQNLREPGMVVADDGVTRSYDAAGRGTVFSSGGGAIVLKLLEDAEADQDPIIAVISGSAIGNDGRGRVSMSAPSVAGQVAVIREAQQVAGLEPSDIDYVEGHGTATPVGDAIEVSALNEVFEGASQPIALGSVKTQIGHCGTAAGIASMIKTLLMVERGHLVASLHFEKSGHDVPLAEGPFRVVAEQRPWTRRDPETPRRAGISAFGLGGANAHVIVEEYAGGQATTSDHPVAPGAHLLAFSAASEAGVRATVQRLADAEAATRIADVANTLVVGRAELSWRTSLVASDSDSDGDRPRTYGERWNQVPVRVSRASSAPKLVMAFTGFHPAGLSLVELADEPAIRSIVAAADGPMLAAVGVSAEEILFVDPVEPLPFITAQASQFVFQVALTNLWRSWGIEPSRVIGHSLGEYAAAHAAGVLNLATGLRLVAARGDVLEKLPRDGGMAAISVGRAQVDADARQLSIDVDIAAVNGPRNTVVAGPEDALDRLRAHYEAAGERVKFLGFGRAGHSRALDPWLDEFRQAISHEPLALPAIEMISTVTGASARDELATHGYWVDHLRRAVQFEAGLSTAMNSNPGAILEVGPAPVLTGLTTDLLPDEATTLVPSLSGRAPQKEELLAALGRLWEIGFQPTWPAVLEPRARRTRVPGTVFHRSRHWIEAVAEGSPTTALPPVTETHWVADERPQEASLPGHWLVLGGESSINRGLVEVLRARGHLLSVPTGWPGTSGDTVAEGDRILQRCLDEAAFPISGVISLEALTPGESVDVVHEIDRLSRRIIGVLKTVAAASSVPPRVIMVTRGQLEASWPLSAVQSVVSAICRTATREYPDLQCLRVDLPPDPAEGDAATIADALSVFDEADIAFRGGERLVRRLVSCPDVSADSSAADPSAGNAASPSGCYLVTGGLGGLGALAGVVLLQKGAGRVVLAGRSAGDIKRQATIKAWISSQVGDIDGRVAFEPLDLTSEPDVAALIRRLDRPERPLRGIVHAAAEIADAPLHVQPSEDFLRGIAAKAFGAWYLHEATKSSGNLDFFTCFTSATGIVGNRGQANYAAANAFVDSLMAHRNNLQMPGQSIAWGPWSEVGRIAENTALLDALDREGMGYMTAEAGRIIMQRMLVRSEGQRAVLTNEWERWATRSNRAEAAFFMKAPAYTPDRHRNAQHVAPVESHADVAESVAEAIRSGSHDRARALLVDALGDAASQILGSTVGPETDLQEAGLDSLSAVQLRNAVGKMASVKMSVNACVEARTIDALCSVAIAEAAAHLTEGGFPR